MNREAESDLPAVRVGNPDVPRIGDGAARAVVLGGGGPVGRAWLAGLAAGLRQQGIDLSDTDVLLGTSAGAITGSWLALGIDLLAEAPAPSTGPDIYRSASSGLGNLMVDFARAARAPDPDAARAAIGARALAVTTVDEATFLARSAYTPLHDQPWPVTFYATAVSATTGRLAVWSAASRVSLASAVASSSAVPGVSPPVTIHDDRYMDGSVRSSFNADLVAGARRVVLVSCFTLTPPPGVTEGPMLYLYEDCATELASITDAGGTLTIIEPSPEFSQLTAFGLQLMDTTLVPQAIEKGQQHAETVAPQLDDWRPRAD